MVCWEAKNSLCQVPGEAVRQWGLLPLSQIAKTSHWENQFSLEIDLVLTLVTVAWLETSVKREVSLRANNFLFINIRPSIYIYKILGETLKALMHQSSRTTHRVKLIPAFLGKRQVLFINFKQNLFKNFFFHRRKCVMWNELVWSVIAKPALCVLEICPCVRVFGTDFLNMIYFSFFFFCMGDNCI